MIRIIDYKAGNAPSVFNAVSRLGFSTDFARSSKDLSSATHIILPGVGSAKATMDSLMEMDMIAALEDAVLGKGALFLGICVGMQILFEHSEEDDADCLGWLKGRVVRFDSSIVRVPQMGWNRVSFVKESAFSAMDDYFYFVNSYYAKPVDSNNIWGISDHGVQFTAAVSSENIFGFQFHAEKSGEAGLSLLDGFLRCGL